MHITFFCILINAVKHLGVTDWAERYNVKHLCLSACKEARPMDARKYTCFCCKGTDFIHSASVNPFAGKQPFAYNMFLQLVHDFVERGHILRIFLTESLFDFFENRFQPCFTHVLVVCIQCVFNFFGYQIGNSVIKVHIYADFFKSRLFFADLILNPFDESNDLFAFFVCYPNRFKHDIFWDFICAGFNHDNFFR